MSYRQIPNKEPDVIIYPLRLQKIMAAAKAANVEYVINSDDRNEMQLEDAARAKPGSLRKYIKSIYRIKTEKRFVIGGKTDEVIIYYMQQEAETYGGGRVQDDRVHGHIWKPKTRGTKNLEGIVTKWDISGTEPFYDIPFSPKAVDDLINDPLNMLDVNQFYVANGASTGPERISGIIYQIFNKEDFKHGSFQELYDMGRYNYTAKEAVLERWRSEGESIRKQSQTFNRMEKVSL